MNAPRIVSLTVALLLTASVDLLAQQNPPVAPGDRVRVSAPSIGIERLVATVLVLKPDTVVVRNREPLALPIASLTKLDVSRDRKSRARFGMIIGFWVGAAAGAVIAGSLENTEDSEFPDVNPDETVGALLGGALLGGLAGAGLGALVGSTIKTDRWEPVPIDRLRVGVVPDRDRWLALSVRFAL